jgi:hypothetical protein
MNERIRELYEQARLQAKSIDADIDPKGWMDMYHQKFAELIVEECATVIERNLFQGIGWNTSRAVKQHFGIGEPEE